MVWQSRIFDIGAVLEARTLVVQPSLVHLLHIILSSVRQLLAPLIPTPLAALKESLEGHGALIPHFLSDESPNETLLQLV